ncbi:SDR family NAD(P)-dependent oxidoreductase [Deinococcus ruber]|uniref:Short-chain dehydrogenase n=1 Tax=Deinococcus ruber TaxID=1848197 RepID=A0A918C8L2_9DEIO|nr:SDR family NAD(P)-dependent oxidoreductase [Deinococcus ruber]GGR12239.1 short-chain dehydrogenase [Deinococcus ruber]
MPLLPPDTRLQGQVIAVTSADQGYGRIISSALARCGADVVLIGNNPETLAAHASSIENASSLRGGGTAIPIKADVGVPMDWRSAQQRILEIFGVLHGIVHLADKRAMSSFTTLSEGEWMDLFNCNVKSSVGIAQIARRYLPSTWLTIIGPHLDEKGLHTSPQRGALKGLVEQAYTEELRANLVLPGRAASSDETLDRPLADAVLALAMPELSHLTGNIVRVPMPAVSSLRGDQGALLTGLMER